MSGYAWPPQGPLAELWARFDCAFADEDKHRLLSLLRSWRAAHSTLVAYKDEDDPWVDVEPDWTAVGAWLEGERPA